MLHLPGRQNRDKPQARILFDGSLPGALPVAGPRVDASSAITAQRTRQVRQMQGRIWLCLAVFGMMFAGLGIRLVDITFLGGQQDRAAPVTAESDPELIRPEITDRTGRHLAMNRVVIGLAVETRDVWNIEDTARKLASAVPGLDRESLEARLASKRHVVLRQELTAEEQAEIMKLGLPGVVYPESPKRVYPQGRLAAHIVGYTVPGQGGASGLEATVDRTERTDTVVSSIDVRAQQILSEELSAYRDQFQAKAAWGVILDAQTGEVIALASLPDYNPNDPAASPSSHWRNRAMYDLYELGSAFKILTAASALEADVTAPQREYDVRQPLQLYDRRITDFHAKGGFMSLSEIVQYSSNIGMAKVALDLGTASQKRFLAALGLMQPLETELPERRMSLLPRQWGPVETATISYGHGIAVTPLQLTAAVAAVVNGGVYYTPTFLKVSGARDGRQVFSQQTSAEMRLILRRVVTDGTARQAEAPGYYVIGKTATADKPSRTGGYQKDQRLSSFVGAFPGYDPRYVILVSFDEPQPTEETYGYATAGIVAAPAFRNIVTRLGPVMGLTPVNDDHAFAGFMSGFRAKDPVRLAMNRQDVEVDEEPVALDDVARLIEGLGP